MILSVFCCCLDLHLQATKREGGDDDIDAALDAVLGDDDDDDDDDETGITGTSYADSDGDSGKASAAPASEEIMKQLRCGSRWQQGLGWITGSSSSSAEVRREGKPG